MPRVAARFLTVRTWESSISPAPYKHDREGSWTNHKSPREILKNILFWISHGSGFGVHAIGFASGFFAMFNNRKITATVHS